MTGLRQVTLLLWVSGVSSVRWFRGWRHREGHLFCNASPLIWHCFRYTPGPGRDTWTTWDVPRRICSQGDRGTGLSHSSPDPVQLLIGVDILRQRNNVIDFTPALGNDLCSRQSYLTFMTIWQGNCSIRLYTNHDCPSVVEPGSYYLVQDDLELTVLLP